MPHVTISIDLSKLPEDARRLLLKTCTQIVRGTRELCYSGDTSIAAGLMENPNLDASILEKLSESKNEQIRGDVACNPKTPEKVLKKLSTDPSVTVRMRVAQNPSTPESIKAEMRKKDDEDWRVQSALDKD